MNIETLELFQLALLLGIIVLTVYVYVKTRDIAEKAHSINGKLDSISDSVSVQLTKEKRKK